MRRRVLVVTHCVLQKTLVEFCCKFLRHKEIKRMEKRETREEREEGSREGVLNTI